MKFGVFCSQLQSPKRQIRNFLHPVWMELQLSCPPSSVWRWKFENVQFSRRTFWFRSRTSHVTTNQPLKIYWQCLMPNYNVELTTLSDDKSRTQQKKRINLIDSYAKFERRIWFVLIFTQQRRKGKLYRQCRARWIKWFQLHHAVHNMSKKPLGFSILAV